MWAYAARKPAKNKPLLIWQERGVKSSAVLLNVKEACSRVRAAMW